MRKISKKGIAVAMSMALVVSGLSFQPAEAAKKPKLSKSKITVNVGKTKKITVKNAKTKAKVTWKTNKKKVAKITKKSTKGKKAYAKIKGVKAGSATITATYKLGKTKKKMTCKVTVKGTSPTNKPTDQPTNKPTNQPTTPSGPTPPGGGDNTPPPAEDETPTPEPTATPAADFDPSTQDYAFFNDYTLGYNAKVVAYKDGNRMSLADAGVEVYNKKEDNIFGQHIKNNYWWNDKITLTAPLQYTDSKGIHDIDSTLTDFDFVADPTAIDNSENDGKLYVYGTTEGIEYSKGVLKKNGYNNHSLTILSTEDMVNWTDEGTLDNSNLTNKVSTAPSKDKVKNGWGTKAWAPSGLKIDGDGDGEDEYYIFYTNSGAVGYVMGDSPVGPWKDPLGKTLFDKNTPNCSDVVWCFDPAVLVDDENNAYCYFGGGIPGSENAHPKTGRVCKLKFKEGTGEVELDGEPLKMDTYYLFEDSEINQINGKYYYSYCTNFHVPGGNKWIGSGQIACYVSSDPMDIAFDPEAANGDQYTDESTGIYHHYLGSILNNPSVIYGESYNNHHHMQTFKGKNYIFYHSTVLSNTLFRDSQQYRNLHVDEISVDEETDNITIEPSYAGASQIEDYNPYENFDGSVRYINATTAAKSAGVNSTRDDIQVEYSVNGSPMVLDNIDTGDWTMIKGVNFGESGLKNIGVEYKSALEELSKARIEVFIDSPTKLANKIATIDINGTTKGYEIKNVNPTQTVTGTHDIYFVFRGSNYQVATWILSEDEDGSNPDLSDRPDAPSNPDTPGTPDGPGIQYGWNAAKTEYTLELNEDNITLDNGATIEDINPDGSVTLCYNIGPSKYPGVWFNFPETSVENFSSIEFTYKDSTAGGFGGAVRYGEATSDSEIEWGGLLPDEEGTWKVDLKGSDDGFTKYKLFKNAEEDDFVYVTITSVKLIK